MPFTRTTWCSVVLFVVPTLAPIRRQIALDAQERSDSAASMLKFVARYDS